MRNVSLLSLFSSLSRRRGRMLTVMLEVVMTLKLMMHALASSLSLLLYLSFSSIASTIDDRNN